MNQVHLGLRNIQRSIYNLSNIIWASLNGNFSSFQTVNFCKLLGLRIVQAKLSAKTVILAVTSKL